MRRYYFWAIIFIIFFSFFAHFAIGKSNPVSSPVPPRVHFATMNGGANIVLAPFRSGYKDFALLQSGTPPFVSPDKYNILPGGSVSFAGRNFVPSESVNIFRAGQYFDTVKVDANGNLNTIEYYIGYQSGMESFSFVGAQSKTPFKVQIKIDQINPWLTLSSYYEPAGAMILAQGHFFGAFEPISLNFGLANLGSIFTDGQGNFNFLFRVPGGVGGTKVITTLGGITGGTVTTTFSQAE